MAKCKSDDTRARSFPLPQSQVLPGNGETYIRRD